MDASLINKTVETVQRIKAPVIVTTSPFMKILIGLFVSFDGFETVNRLLISRGALDVNRAFFFLIESKLPVYRNRK